MAHVSLFSPAASSRGLNTSIYGESSGGFNCGRGAPEFLYSSAGAVAGVVITINRLCRKQYLSPQSARYKDQGDRRTAPTVTTKVLTADLPVVMD